MKIHSIILLVLAAAAMISSCSTQIQMTEFVPALFNMRRGSTIGIRYSGEMSNRVTDALIRKIEQDGYYTLATSPEADYHINVVDIQGSLSDVHCIVTSGRTGTVIYNSVVSQNLEDVGKAWRDIGKDFTSRFVGTQAPESRVDINLARKIYFLFAPHEEMYKVRVSTNSKNPELEQAVTACRRKDWARARQLTQEAMLKYPQDPESHYLMGLLERSESKFEESNAYFNKALELNPDSSKYRSALQKNVSMQQNESRVVEQLSN